MKKIVFLICITLILSCSSDDRQVNPFLPNVSVNFQINLNLPQYDNLGFPGGIFVERTEGRGIKGVIIYNQDDRQFFAYELSDPNVDPNLSCSTLTVEGSRASSNCDGNENIYEITSFGQQIQGEGGFPLLAYRISKSGNVLTITN
ncbi:hypothetical protein U6A24_19135 [Aquimarina gracilis]|uniref:Nitrite reductase/ring-hydroxylating ferredoxin subunit n=1 Tax=Aquimarina gracilis TaxID=874422 RepID=A0ABU6A0B6_9FLAO|nr:hypothetical protein [Aquimarina gracilis]MEB3347599.1 hypothetical protein [Aquimarina gracilis]